MDQERIISAIRKYCRRTGVEGLGLKTIMFDMDGVLFDSMPYHAKSWHRAMADFGLELSEAEAFLHEGRTGSGTITIVMQRQLSQSPTEERCKEIYARKSEYFNSFPEALPMPGAYATVSRVKEAGITPIIVTGSGQASLLSRIDRHYSGLFRTEWMVTAKDVKYGKPNPEPYMMGMQKAGGLKPWESMVVENAPLGVEAGHKAGCFVIAVNTGPLDDEILLDAGADILFHSMDELSENIRCIINLTSVTTMD